MCYELSVSAFLSPSNSLGPGSDATVVRTIASGLSLACQVHVLQPSSPEDLYNFKLEQHQTHLRIGMTPCQS